MQWKGAYIGCRWLALYKLIHHRILVHFEYKCFNIIMHSERRLEIKKKQFTEAQIAFALRDAVRGTLVGEGIISMLKTATQRI